MTSLFPSLLRTTPRLPKNFFICHQCISKSTTRHFTKPSRPSSILNNLRHGGVFTRTQSTATIDSASSPLRNLKSTLQNAQQPTRTKSSSFPETSSKAVAYWLLASAGSVFGLVVFGGLTRLTESGLSITEWRPVAGSLPPLNATEWQSEFDLYRASPEFKLLNPHMNLEEFKKIYYMEWGHRLWGRFVGLSFALPALYFVARRRVSLRMSLRLLGIAGLIGFQGVIGWWMVKSGLKDDLFAPGSHPRVSQYRLTAHLGTAFLCYSLMLWNGLSILRSHSFLSSPTRALPHIATLHSAALSPFRKSIAALLILVFCTAMSGGLVAGLDAGMIYNEFPRMGTGLTPPKSELFDKFYSRLPDNSDLWWRNMLENPSLVQLDHRILATTTFTSICGIYAYTLTPKLRTVLPATAKRAMLGVVGLVSLQVTLGISTLIYLVPIELASAHQAGAIALLSGVLVLGNRIWVPRRTLAMVKRAVERGGSVGAGGKGIGGSLRPTAAMRMAAK